MFHSNRDLKNYINFKDNLNLGDYGLPRRVQPNKILKTDYFLWQESERRSAEGKRGAEEEIRKFPE